MTRAYKTSSILSGISENGTTIVADNSTSTGLRYQAPKTQNAVYNSGFDVWQRGTSSTANSTGGGTGYTADRWQSTYTSATMTTSRQATGDTTNLPNIQYCARVQRNSGQTGVNNVIISQTLETMDSIRFSGQTVTLSFWARAGANYSGSANGLIATLVYGTGTDQNVLWSFNGATAVSTVTKTLTTTWQRFSITGTIATTATELGYYFYYAPTGTAGANDYFEITGVQLETGSVATPFNRQSGSIQGELAACQRYFWNYCNNTTQAIGIATFNSTIQAEALVQFPVAMRTAPTLSITTGTSFYYLERVAKGVTTLIAFYTTTNNTGLYSNSFTGLTAGQSDRLATNSASASISFSAEL